MSSKVKRNGPCPCGSGQKAKKCCLREMNKLKTRVLNGESPQSILVERLLNKENEA